MKGMQTKNKRIYNQNETNRMENKKRKEINDELEYKKRGIVLSHDCKMNPRYVTSHYFENFFFLCIKIFLWFFVLDVALSER